MKKGTILMAVIISITGLVIFGCNSHSPKKVDTSVLIQKRPNNKFEIQADSLKMLGEFDAALKNYNKSLEIDKSINTLYNITYIYALENNLDSAFYHLDLINASLDSSAWRLSNGQLINLVNDSRWKDVVDIRFEKYQAKFGNLIYPDLSKKLMTIDVLDQSYNTLMNIYPDSTDYYWKKKIKINDKNVQDAEEIIANYGWVLTKDVGQISNYTLFLVFQHCGDVKLMRKYEPLLRKNAEIDDFFKNQYATYIDRILGYEGKNQIYGTQMSYDSLKQVYYLGDNLASPDSLSILRKRMKLNPIEDYLKTMNAELRIEVK